VIQYKLGLEYYRNDSGKEMDGAILIHFESDKPFEDVKLETAQSLTRLHEAAVKAIEDEKFKAKLASAIKHDPTYADCVACFSTVSDKGRNNVTRIVSTDAYWFHLFISDEMKKQRQTMFEKTDDELSAHFQEPSIEVDDVTGDVASSSQNLDASGLSLTNDAYFSKVGVELNGLPDFWMVQAGLV